VAGKVSLEHAGPESAPPLTTVRSRLVYDGQGTREKEALIHRINRINPTEPVGDDGTLAAVKIPESGGGCECGGRWAWR